MKQVILDKKENIDHCPIRSVLSRIGDKWSVLIITTLGERGVMRFNEISRTIGDISQKMLTSTLRSLEEDGLIIRHIYPEVPPRVEYQLTKLGASLLPFLESLSEWASENMSTILYNRDLYKKKNSGR